jgi:hypothetical protein
MIRLTPPIPINCPKGPGQALFVTDYSTEHNLVWTIAIDETGEIWQYQNPLVRMQSNITMGREIEGVKHLKRDSSSVAQKLQGVRGVFSSEKLGVLMNEISHHANDDFKFCIRYRWVITKDKICPHCDNDDFHV